MSAKEHATVIPERPGAHKTVLQYTEPAGAQPGKDFTRKLDEGLFALQGHDPKSTIRYRNIRVKRLD